MPTLEDARLRLQDDLQRARRELSSYAGYEGPWRICLFQCEPADEDFVLNNLDGADRAGADDQAAADAAAELRTTVLFEISATGATGADGADMRSVLATPILDPLITDPSPLQQFVLGVVTFASGVPVETWTDRYEFQMIASKYAQRLASDIITG